jgi:hypothetical protein
MLLSLRADFIHELAGIAFYFVLEILNVTRN